MPGPTVLRFRICLVDRYLADVARTVVDNHVGNLDVTIEYGLLFEVKFAAADEVTGDTAVNDRIHTVHGVGKGNLGTFFNDQTLAADLAHDPAMAAHGEITRAINTAFQDAMNEQMVAAYGDPRNGGFFLDSHIATGLDAPVPILADVEVPERYVGATGGALG